MRQAVARIEQAGQICRMSSAARSGATACQSQTYEVADVEFAGVQGEVAISLRADRPRDRRHAQRHAPRAQTRRCSTRPKTPEEWERRQTTVGTRQISDKAVFYRRRPGTSAIFFDRLNDNARRTVGAARLLFDTRVEDYRPAAVSLPALTT